ncbi:hypothetical protein Tco_0779259, partial [Tanacetum coccineum]
MNELHVRLNILRLTISPEACSFMLCDLDFEPLSLSLSLANLGDSMSYDQHAHYYALLESFKSELTGTTFGTSLNLERFICRGLNSEFPDGYDQKSFDEERGLNCVVQTGHDELTLRGSEVSYGISYKRLFRLSSLRSFPLKILASSAVSVSQGWFYKFNVLTSASSKDLQVSSGTGCFGFGIQEHIYLGIKLLIECEHGKDEDDSMHRPWVMIGRQRSIGPLTACDAGREHVRSRLDVPPVRWKHIKHQVALNLK